MRVLPRPLVLFHWACLALLFGLLAYASLTSWWATAWQPALFYLGAVGLAILVLLPALLRRELRPFPPLFPFALALIWIALQLVLHTTVYRFPTEQSMLQGFSLFCVFWCTRVLADQLDGTRLMLDVAITFAGLVTIAGGVAHELRPTLALGLFPLLRKQELVFWGFSSYNEYAQFAELFLPILLWKAVRRGWQGWLYWLTAAAILVAAIGLGSRMGAALVVLEVPATILLSLAPAQRRRLLPVLAGTTLLGVLAAGAWVLTQRGLSEAGSRYGYRPEMALAAWRMWQDHPLTGVGLGNYPVVHPAYAVFDSGLVVNAAHNDFLQALAEGGPVFLGLMLWCGITQLRGLSRATWGIGLLAVSLHALVDFPFHWLSISSWFVFLLALVKGTRSASVQTQKGPLPE